jgi:hypothetical protein
VFYLSFLFWKMKNVLPKKSLIIPIASMLSLVSCHGDYIWDTLSNENGPATHTSVGPKRDTSRAVVHYKNIQKKADIVNVFHDTTDVRIQNALEVAFAFRTEYYANPKGDPASELSLPIGAYFINTCITDSLISLDDVRDAKINRKLGWLAATLFWSEKENTQDTKDLRAILDKLCDSENCGDVEEQIFWIQKKRGQ